MANQEALSRYPTAEHVLAIDSFYLRRADAISRLLETYKTLSSSQECILGASTWYYERARIRPVIRFYDIGSTPEMEGLSWLRLQDIPSGLIRVSSVGACYIYPKWTWIKHGYAIPEPFPSGGIFHNWLCKESGLPVFLDCDVRLWRSHADNPDIIESGLLDRIRRTLRVRHRFNRFVLRRLTVSPG